MKNFKRKFNIRLRDVCYPLLFSFLSTLLGCGKPTKPCGTFQYSGTALPGGGGATVSVTFNFRPSTCASSCNCSTICYVQIVRNIDRSTGAFLAPNSDQQNRTVTGNAVEALNGCAVDRISCRNWGYYARNEDGTFASYLSTGSNSTPAILNDQPSGWGPNVLVRFC